MLHGYFLLLSDLCINGVLLQKIELYLRKWCVICKNTYTKTAKLRLTLLNVAYTLKRIWTKIKWFGYTAIVLTFSDSETNHLFIELFSFTITCSSNCSVLQSSVHRTIQLYNHLFIELFSLTSLLILITTKQLPNVAPFTGISTILYTPKFKCSVQYFIPWHICFLTLLIMIHMKTYEFVCWCMCVDLSKK